MTHTILPSVVTISYKDVSWRYRYDDLGLGTYKGDELEFLAVKFYHTYAETMQENKVVRGRHGSFVDRHSHTRSLNRLPIVD